MSISARQYHARRVGNDGVGGRALAAQSQRRRDSTGCAAQLVADGIQLRSKSSIPLNSLESFNFFASEIPRQPESVPVFPYRLPLFQFALALRLL